MPQTVWCYTYYHCWEEVPSVIKFQGNFCNQRDQEIQLLNTYGLPVFIINNINIKPLFILITLSLSQFYFNFLHLIFLSILSIHIFDIWYSNMILRHAIIADPTIFHLYCVFLIRSSFTVFKTTISLLFICLTFKYQK